MNIKHVIVVGSCLGVTVASASSCSGPVEGRSDVFHGESTEQAGPTAVADVAVADAKVTFYVRTQNGHTDVGMLESGSAYAKNTIVAPLLAQRLTTQEIFLALAPAGSVVPPALVAAQAEEAAAFGRSADVRRVVIDPTALIEKSLTSCENAILGTTPPGGSEFAWAAFEAGNFDNSGSAWTYQYPTYNQQNCSASSNYTTDWAIMGGCNESSTTVNFMAIEGWNCYNGYNYINGSGGTTLSNGYYAYWYWQAGTGGANYTLYSLVASGATTWNYDMLIGYQYPKIPPR